MSGYAAPAAWHSRTPLPLCWDFEFSAEYSSKVSISHLESAKKNSIATKNSHLPNKKKGVGVFGGGSKKMPTQKKIRLTRSDKKKNNSVSPQELHLPGSKAQSVVVKGFGTPEASGEKDGGGYMFNLKNT